MKNYCCFVLITFALVLSLNAQNESIKKEFRKTFVQLKNVNTPGNEISNRIITSSDTLIEVYNSYNIEKDIKLCNCASNDTLIWFYKSRVFGHYTKKKKKSYQWNTEITIYLDKRLSKKIRKSFKEFYRPLEEDNIINISYSTNPLDANYHIIVSDSIMKVETNSKGKPDINHYLSSVTYKLTSDYNNKYYAAKLIVDAQSIMNDNLVLEKIKRLFFMSLGQFPVYSSKYMKESLLVKSNINTDAISDIDLDILRLHYFKIHDYDFSIVEFYKNLKKIKAICQE